MRPKTGQHSSLESYLPLSSILFFNGVPWRAQRPAHLQTTFLEVQVFAAATAKSKNGLPLAVQC